MSVSDMVQDILATKDESGAYTAELKECVYKLLSCNVSTRHVSNVIGAVLKLAGNKAEDLPSNSTVTDWNITRLVISQSSLQKNYQQKRLLGLLSEETSKFGEKFGGFHASDTEGCFM